MALRTLQKRVARLLAREAIRVARPVIRTHSRTLAGPGGVRVEEGPLPGQSALEIPHYWAVYLHDGRRAIRKPGGFLIYYRNPAEDPRFSGRQTPPRAASVRRLTTAEFRQAVRRNRQARARGRQPPVVIVRAVGPVAEAANFFENDEGMLPFILSYPRIAREEVLKEFRRTLKTALRVEERTLRIFLG